jgi:hypothetical protein
VCESAVPAVLRHVVADEQDRGHRPPRQRRPGAALLGHDERAELWRSTANASGCETASSEMNMNASSLVSSASHGIPCAFRGDLEDAEGQDDRDERDVLHEIHCRLLARLG